MSSEAAILTSIPAAAYQALGAFRCAMSTYDHVSAARIKASGLTVQQYALLVLVAGRGTSAPSVGEAAQELMLSHNSAVELSQRAEKAGLLVRQNDPQLARRTLLMLSREGANRLDTATRRLVGELGQERLELQDALIRWRTLLDSGSFGRIFQEEPATTPLTPAFEVNRVGEESRPVIWNLLQLHLHSMGPYHQMDVGPEGQYPYPEFERYWQGAAHQPYLIRVGDRPAGFVLLHRLAVRDTELHELCLLPHFQAQGLGRGVMVQLFGWFPGRWSVEYHHQNLSAGHFWHRVLQNLAVEPERETEVTRLTGKGCRIEFSVSLTT